MRNAGNERYKKGGMQERRDAGNGMEQEKYVPYFSLKQESTCGNVV